MSRASKADFIGFPPPLLGGRPIRLPVLVETQDWLALDKSAGFGVREHPWDELPHLDGALNQQLVNGKPELLRRNAEIFGSVYYVEPGVSGVAVFAKTRASVGQLRNSYGSGHLSFRYLFVAGPSVERVAEAQLIEAPLLAHRVKPKMIPSTAKGKKAETTFRRLSESRLGWSLWEAQTRYPRVHQVRAHAALLGQAVMGDHLYGGEVAPTLKQLFPKKRGKGVELSLFDGIALHLYAVRLPSLGSEIGAGCSVFSPLPRRFTALLKRLELNFVETSCDHGELSGGRL